MKIERDQYRKNLELEYKEFSEQQMIGSIGLKFQNVFLVLIVKGISVL